MPPASPATSPSPICNGCTGPSNGPFLRGQGMRSMGEAAFKITRRTAQISAQRAEIEQGDLAASAAESNARAFRAAPRDRLRRAFLAIQRQNSVLALLDLRHGRQGRRDPVVAAQFAKVLLSALCWEIRHHPALHKGDHLPTALAELRRLLPGLTADAAARLERDVDPEAPMNNGAAGAALGLTWSEYEELRRKGSMLQPGKKRSVQVRPCDVSETEFNRRRAALNKELDAARKAATRTRQGGRTAKARAADEAANRAALTTLSTHHGVSVRTIRRWIENGKIAEPACQNAVQMNKKKNRSDTILTKTTDGTGGGLKPPAGPRQLCTLICGDDITLEAEPHPEMNGTGALKCPRPDLNSEVHADKPDATHDSTCRPVGNVSYDPLVLALEVVRAGPWLIGDTLSRAASAVRAFNDRSPKNGPRSASQGPDTGSDPTSDNRAA